MQTYTCVLLKSSGFSVIYDERVSQENALTLEAAKVIGTKIFHPAKRSCRNFTCFRWVFCHLRRRRNAPSCKSHTRQEKPSLPLFVFSQALPSACRCPDVKSRKGVSTLQVLWIPLQTGVLPVKHVYSIHLARELVLDQDAEADMPGFSFYLLQGMVDVKSTNRLNFVHLRFPHMLLHVCHGKEYSFGVRLPFVVTPRVNSNLFAAQSQIAMP